jgi:chemotaxis protein CheY-P-specific phosphatase CheC
MAGNRKEILVEVFCNVLENLAFMFAEAIEDEEVRQTPEAYLVARMRFAGPMRGALRLAAPAPMCTEIAANVLGLDPEDAMVATGSEDALKELLNVTCGHVLTALAGEEPVFDLSVPDVSALPERGWSELAQSDDTVAFLIDDYVVLLQLSIDN